MATSSARRCIPTPPTASRRPTDAGVRWYWNSPPARQPGKTSNGSIMHRRERHYSGQSGLVGADWHRPPFFREKRGGAPPQALRLSARGRLRLARTADVVIHVV